MLDDLLGWCAAECFENLLVKGGAVLVLNHEGCLVMMGLMLLHHARSISLVPYSLLQGV